MPRTMRTLAAKRSKHAAFGARNARKLALEQLESRQLLTASGLAAPSAAEMSFVGFDGLVPPGLVPTIAALSSAAQAYPFNPGDSSFPTSSYSFPSNALGVDPGLVSSIAMLQGPPIQLAMLGSADSFTAKQAALDSVYAETTQHQGPADSLVHDSLLRAPSRAQGSTTVGQSNRNLPSQQSQNTTATGESDDPMLCLVLFDRQRPAAGTHRSVGGLALTRMASLNDLNGLGESALLDEDRGADEPVASTQQRSSSTSPASNQDAAIRAFEAILPAGKFGIGHDGKVRPQTLEKNDDSIGIASQTAEVLGAALVDALPSIAGNETAAAADLAESGAEGCELVGDRKESRNWWNYGALAGVLAATLIRVRNRATDRTDEESGAKRHTLFSLARKR